MKLFKYFCCDCRIGIWKKIRYLLLTAVVIMRCMELPEPLFLVETMGGGGTLTLADCMAVIFNGAYPMNRFGGQDSFRIPPGWMIMLFLLMILPLDYPWKSMDLWGHQYTIRQTKRQWWLGKCLYTIWVELFGFTSVIGTAVLFCLCKGYALAWTNNYELYRSLFGWCTLNFTAPLSPGQNLVLLVICPLCGILVMSLLQLCITVWIHPAVAYLFSVVTLLFTAYGDYFWLPGNYCMAYRSVYIDVQGIRPKVEILVSVLLSLAVIIIGTVVIRKKDIIALKKVDA